MAKTTVNRLTSSWSSCSTRRISVDRIDLESRFSTANLSLRISSIGTMRSSSVSLLCARRDEPCSMPMRRGFDSGRTSSPLRSVIVRRFLSGSMFGLVSEILHRSRSFPDAWLQRSGRGTTTKEIPSRTPGDRRRIPPCALGTRR